MAEYNNLKKFIYSYNDVEYNNNTQSGTWKLGSIDDVDVWFMEIDYDIYTIIEPVVVVYQLLLNNTYKQYDPYKTVISLTGITIYIDKNNNPNRIEGKVIII